jgi:hypothetical protein
MLNWSRNQKPYDNILQAAGLTPLVRLNKVAKDVDATIYGKVEYFNPSGRRVLAYGSPGRCA